MRRAGRPRPFNGGVINVGDDNLGVPQVVSFIAEEKFVRGTFYVLRQLIRNLYFLQCGTSRTPSPTEKKN